MKKFSQIFMIAAVSAVMFVACDKEAEVADVELKSTTTYPKGEVTAHPGNFISSVDDNQVCYDIAELLYPDAEEDDLEALTKDMVGFKIDPPVDFPSVGITNDLIKVTLNGKKYLDWEAFKGTEVVAFIVKGGPNYNLYNYFESGLTYDKNLSSPLHSRKVPDISHYNFCYIPPVQDVNGCTPGYWRNHSDRWEILNPGDNFDVTFGVSLFGPTVTLGQVISNPQTYGAFYFHAVAALLNAYGGTPNADGTTTVNYKYTPERVIELVQEGEVNKNLLVTANEQGCPLSGTKADKVL
jgi:hypothetical protein